MGGTAPICPFCKKECASGGVKDHIRAKYLNKYKMWINYSMLPYWRYDDNGELIHEEVQNEVVKLNQE